ncbi:MAG: site-specific integrase [Parachlamydia sp.]|nr:site-specific integrase [Parachlamydia sp.]
MASKKYVYDEKGKLVRVYVQVRLKGHPVEHGTFKNETLADRWIQSTEAAIREGRYFKVAEAKKHTLGEMIDRYIRTVLPTKKKSERKQTAQLLWWKQQIGSYLLSDVTPALIANQRDLLLNGTTRRGTERSPSTVVRYMAALSHAFTIAKKEWNWIDESPITKVKKPREPRGRVRFLDAFEQDKLLQACRASSNQYLYTIVVVALSTGMRKAEILNLKWSDIDLEKERIILRETKNGEIRQVPIKGHALALLKDLDKIRRIDTHLLFPRNYPKSPIDIRTAWENAVKKAELPDFRFHDLRHTCASYLAMNGASLAEMAEILGHKTLSLVKRYAHLSENHTAGVVSRMNEKIFR